MAAQTTFTLNYATPTGVSITVTDFGSSVQDGAGTSSDLYKFEYVNTTDSGNTYVFNAPSNFFSFDVPKLILYNAAQWESVPDIALGDNITGELYNTQKINILRSDAMTGTVANSTVVQTAFTLNSVTTTDLTITVTNFGANGYTPPADRTGNSGNEYRINFITGVDSYFYDAPQDFFTLNVPKTILYSDEAWNIDFVVSVNDNITVELSNINITSIPGSAAMSGTVTGGGGGGGGGGGVPCFVASSKLLTPTGYCAAKDIKTGDLLMTADGRQVPVKAYSFNVEVADKESAPFFIPKNSISMGCPNADLRLSPWHAFQMKKGLWMKPISALELGMSVQQYDLGKPVTYYHFEAPNFFKDNFVCEGTVVESFGGVQIKGMKGRPYTYNSSLKGYTRVASKPVSKAIRM